MLERDYKRNSMTHVIDIQTEEYQRIEAGKQSYFIMKDDADYRLGDRLTFVEMVVVHATGRRKFVNEIKSITDNIPGLEPGYIILQF